MEVDTLYPGLEYATAVRPHAKETFWLAGDMVVSLTNRGSGTLYVEYPAPNGRDSFTLSVGSSKFVVASGDMVVTNQADKEQALIVKTFPVLKSGQKLTRENLEG